MSLPSLPGFALFVLIAHSGAAQERFEFAVMGCMPYHMPEDATRFENIIATVNAASPAFSVHCGDIKWGRSPCDDASLERVKGWFDRFEKPLIYVPGDNEWTDCRTRPAGGHDPVERLNAVRHLFYPSPAGLSLGKQPIELLSQSRQPGYADFVEHQRWERSGIAFATLHVVGSHNNLVINDAAAVAEFRTREKAVLAWMRESFARAGETGIRALALFIQANPFDELKRSAPRGDGYASFVAMLREETLKLSKPVYLFHADSHYFRIDKPLLSETGRLVENFTRIETFGGNNLHLVRVEADPGSSDPLRASPWLVEANRVDPAAPLPQR